MKRRSLDDMGLSVLWYDWRDGTAINQLSFDWLEGDIFSIFKGNQWILFSMFGDHSSLRMTDDGANPWSRSQSEYDLVILV